MLGIIFLIGTVIWIIVGVAGAGALLAQCADLGPGVHELDNGVTVTCG